MQAVPMPEPEPVDDSKPAGLDSLTAGETAMAERQAAQSITTIGNPHYPQATLLGALGWVLHRRTEPRTKFDDYMSSRTLTDVTRELGLSGGDEDDEDDDDDAAGKDEEPSTSPN